MGVTREPRSKGGACRAAGGGGGRQQLQGACALMAQLLASGRRARTPARRVLGDILPGDSPAPARARAARRDRDRAASAGRRLARALAASRKRLAKRRGSNEAHVVRAEHVDRLVAALDAHGGCLGRDDNALLLVRAGFAHLAQASGQALLERVSGGGGRRGGERTACAGHGAGKGHRSSAGGRWRLEPNLRRCCSRRRKLASRGRLSDDVIARRGSPP